VHLKPFWGTTQTLECGLITVCRRQRCTALGGPLMQQSVVLPLCCFLLLARGGAGGVADPDEPIFATKWYKEEHEYSFIESLCLILFFVLALIFEICWHHIKHQTEHSYVYGDLLTMVDSSTDEGPTHGVTRHVRLTKEMTNRAGGEFMTLGFLAFVIFLFHNTGGFSWLLRRFPPSENLVLPGTTQDWLHMVEMTHMKLFCGMAFYFVLISRVVNASVLKIRLWEQLAFRSRLAVVEEAAVWNPLKAMDTDLAEHILWRRYFIDKMVRRLQKAPESFAPIINALGLDPSSDVSEALQHFLDHEFSFGEYLALNVETGVCDSIQIHATTWIFVILMFVCFACGHHFRNISLTDMLPVFLGCMALVLALIRALVWNSLGTIEKRVRKPPNRPSASDSPVHVRSTGSPGEPAPARPFRIGEWMTRGHRREVVILRLFQVILFLNSYMFARTVLDFQSWMASPEKSMLYTCLFALLFVGIGYYTPKRVPVFLAIMAMPPHVNAGNLSIFFSVLLRRKPAQEPMRNLPRSNTLFSSELDYRGSMRDVNMESLRRDTIRSEGMGHAISDASFAGMHGALACASDGRPWHPTGHAVELVCSRCAAIEDPFGCDEQTASL